LKIVRARKGKKELQKQQKINYFDSQIICNKKFKNKKLPKKTAFCFLIR